MDTRSFEGLKALVESSFPKKCRNCGRIYETAEQFFSETLGMSGGRSSLKAAIEENGGNVVEAFRNCRCGSTLMDEFACRRDVSEEAVHRREAFGKFLSLLQSRNVSADTARIEILNYLSGKPNNLGALLDIDVDD